MNLRSLSPKKHEMLGKLLKMKVMRKWRQREREEEGGEGDRMRKEHRIWILTQVLLRHLQPDEARVEEGAKVIRMRKEHRIWILMQVLLNHLQEDGVGVEEEAGEMRPLLLHLQRRIPNLLQRSLHHKLLLNQHQLEEGVEGEGEGEADSILVQERLLLTKGKRYAE
jgi:hypothetical protein